MQSETQCRNPISTTKNSEHYWPDSDTLPQTELLYTSRIGIIQLGSIFCTKFLKGRVLLFKSRGSKSVTISMMPHRSIVWFLKEINSLELLGCFPLWFSDLLCNLLITKANFSLKVLRKYLHRLPTGIPPILLKD